MKTTAIVPGMLYVADDVLRFPLTYRDTVRELEFGTVAAGPDAFHGIAPCVDPELPDLLMRLLPAGALPTLSFFRRSPEGQVEPTYIHSDGMMGDWTAILYLNVDPPVGDGTLFWEHPTFGRWGFNEVRASEPGELWTCWHHVDARFNRMVVFKSDLYHSRAIAENYGTGNEARLIQVVFGRGAMPA